MPEGRKTSRLKSYKDLDENSSFLKLPKLDGADYLVNLLFEAGLLESTGMGAAALSWSEIESWLRVTQLDLSVWERLTIKSMSEVYVAELSTATKKDSPAPYIHADEIHAADRAQVADKLKNAFAFLRGNNKE